MALPVAESSQLPKVAGEVPDYLVLQLAVLEIEAPPKPSCIPFRKTDALGRSLSIAPSLPISEAYQVPLDQFLDHPA